MMTKPEISARNQQYLHILVHTRYKNVLWHNLIVCTVDPQGYDSKRLPRKQLIYSHPNTFPHFILLAVERKQFSS